MSQLIEVIYGARVAVIWLNRPEVHHALNEEMVRELTQALLEANQNEKVSAIVLASRGDSFCSGTDLSWYQRCWKQGGSPADAPEALLTKMLKAIDASSVPVIARVNGHCIGSGIGLVAAADIVVASHDAEFTQSETSLGLTPRLVAPYLSRAIGVRTAGRWLMTGETFSAAEAWRLGLVHEICEASELDARINSILGHLITAEPGAVQSTRKIVQALHAGSELGIEALKECTEPSVNTEGALAQEGVAAFLEKRWPSWAPEELRS
ncbi:enoyl-CoA hydratase-related protein [Zwartia vadi]|uniref:enoyl-CoA hydratase-related protein n=1 Tax=Zwartia vadi TaxID=3058168 RepID=UPI0025B5CAC5|nr:enoyl-CoA hydratase-related protein [Zwartia vadi]MDN3987283.1 enoyl-CoA hydratase-related protein [Zwartia vadi]